MEGEGEGDGEGKKSANHVELAQNLVERSVAR
jgi:hypothetical protein